MADLPAQEDAAAAAAIQEKVKLALSVGEECTGAEDLAALFKNKPTPPICYDGFEPSGRVHIAQGVMKALNVNKLTSSGCVFKFWVADWFAQLNNKMGGDLHKIQTVGRYMIEVWKAVGMNLNQVEFLWSSHEINSRAEEYWKLVFDIARRNNLPRILRCSQIMGRTNPKELSVSAIMYACMQCADVFFLKADICQLGLDQRKVNMLAREYASATKRKFKPIILSHHMLPGLKEGQLKMSKSDPESAIFMEDEEDDVNRKIAGAFCPNVVEGNPCLEYVKYVVIPWHGRFELCRSEERGGNLTYESAEKLNGDFESGLISSDEIKTSLAKSLNLILQPVRDHFKHNADARDLLAQVKSFRVTR
ncbi:tyrosine--tRNA ligase 1, cytoplasmic [Selaginella moellendorffii]|uniref:tyrosine--tRNA ligase 1, cytoplasmic n=1 Tax=Selaginella moellendorffii TaxID=88036 RepID=UPI000D1D01C0|nr:tyrosine--tRNA ligase 1, cytoplasmic [Selaginella moellendorffii]XP_024534839.1 tyrosine--tRNA ligase 1, cytoplasmic [Selaginella moellendorffii]|eukprot:XP_024525188.1 tyrosine--tRNA ligase 1, cytoplasmic [Selaginella moellendorffii]